MNDFKINNIEVEFVLIPSHLILSHPDIYNTIIKNLKYKMV